MTREHQPRTLRTGLRSAAVLIAASAALATSAAGCSDDRTPSDVDDVQAPIHGKTAKIDILLRTLEAKGHAAADAHKAMPEGLVNAKAGKGNNVTLVDVLIEGPPSTIADLQQLGIKIRTVTSSGVMTASLPLHELHAAASVAGVTRISAAKRVKMVNDKSNGLVGGTHSFGMNNDRSGDGSGVVVGVIDSGLDWTHEDFTDDITGESRIAYYWDQSDVADAAPPGGLLDYGTVYTKADFDDYNLNGNTAAVANSAKDTNGHGTHVTGTAAGDGSASGGLYKGVAPAADIVFVKFDFDGDRNSTAAIVDGVSYIFQKAAELGKPAVINMSLGSDYGPADGSTAEERGIDDLTGPGKVVVVAAGNPGANNWSDKLSWGYALHGSGELSADPISFRFPSNLVTNGEMDYAFFDIWHDAGTCTVTVSYEGTPRCQASTENAPGYVSACRFAGRHQIIIGQSSDVLGYESNSGSTEIYVELPPFTGNWEIGFSNCSGTYHAKYGASSNVIKQWRAEPTPRVPTPTFGGEESNNAYTIGNPASATKVLAVAAYQSRDQWQYVYGINNTCDGVSEGTQSYGVAPIDYYDAYDLGQLAYFSGRGPRRDGDGVVTKPDIAAPGVGIASAFSSHARALEAGDKCTDYFDGGFYHYGTNRVLPGEEYMVIQGTSMACPNATGAVALLLAQKPDLDVDQLRALLSTTARVDGAVTTFESADFTSGTDTDVDAGLLPNNDWGHGKLDIVNSLAGLPTCAGQCLYDSDCTYGGTCTVSTSLLTCSSCSGGCVATETPDESSCDGVDNDCDGETDEDLLNACGSCLAIDETLLGQSCGDCGIWACSGDDIACDDPGFTICGNCDPVPEEVCNGVDDDCDALIDEDLGTDSCGVGECADTVNACVGGVVQICTPKTAPEANGEQTCDDGKDNDCDGKTDEADADCAGSCGQKGDSCQSGDDCCSDKCLGPPNGKSCK